MTIRQLVVDRTAQSSGVARALVERLIALYEGHRRGLDLTCRRDFPANDVWPKLGFVPTAERPGRGRQARTLTRWWHPLAREDLFTLANSLDERGLVALDTNLIIRGADGDPEVTEKLLADWIRAAARFAIAPGTLIELNRHGDPEVRRAHQRYAMSFEAVQDSPAVVQSIEARIIERVGDRSRPHRKDIRLAAQAASGAARWFVTEDRSFRKACAQAFREVAEIAVVSIAEFVYEIDREERGETYRPSDLMGTDVEVRPLHVGELDSLVETFVNHSAGEAIRSWRSRLHDLAGDVDRTAFIVFASGPDVLALVGLQPGPVLQVPVCRVRRGAAEPTLARQTLGWIRQQTLAHGARGVAITDPAPGRWIEGMLIQEGFLDERIPIAVPAPGSGSFGQLAEHLEADPLSAWVGGNRAADLRQLESTARAAYSVETAFHPYILLGSGLPTYRIPIKPHYAASLFDHGLSGSQLFPRDRPTALRREHVYFRSPTGRLQAPARLLWYVSGKPGDGGRAIRGRSILNDVVVGDVDQLMRRFAHLGVLDPTEIRDRSRAGLVMALRFSHTTLFERPVGLDEYRELMRTHDPHSGLTLVAPQRVPEQVFASVASLGG